MPPKRKFSRRDEARDDAFNDDRPPAGDAVRYDKPWEGPGNKGKGKKAHKGKFTHGGGKPGDANAAGTSAPKKKKKPKKHPG